MASFNKVNKFLEPFADAVSSYMVSANDLHKTIETPDLGDPFPIPDYELKRETTYKNLGHELEKIKEEDENSKFNEILAALREIKPTDPPPVSTIRDVVNELENFEPSAPPFEQVFDVSETKIIPSSAVIPSVFRQQKIAEGKKGSVLVAGEKIHGLLFTDLVQYYIENRDKISRKLTAPSRIGVKPSKLTTFQRMTLIKENASRKPTSLKDKPKGKENVKPKSYVCQECDKKFTRKDSLTRHLQSLHKSIKFKCSKCGKKFSRPNNLKQHIRLCSK
jgi:DNA-directed RNA polymerase subunit RPC12/RpoP